MHKMLETHKLKVHKYVKRPIMAAPAQVRHRVGLFQDFAQLGAIAANFKYVYNSN